MLDLTLPHDDPLGVLTSTRFVVERAESVAINPDALRQIANDLATNTTEPPDWHDSRHFSDGSWRTAGWVLVLDTLNFCFWSESQDRSQRWLVEWNGQIENGYWALAAALTRAVDEGFPLWDPAWIGNLTESDLRCILRPHQPDGTEIPLFADRLRNLHELGNGLLSAFPESDNPVRALIESTNGSAIELIRSVVSYFPSFNDVASYQGEEIRFYKRAQILIADLAGAFDGVGLGAFHNLAKLTAFADYKVPQVLRGLNALVYSPDLDAAIAARTLIPPGSPWEVEIRAATIWACELLRQSLVETGKSYLATEIDWFLWLAGQSLPESTPTYHRTYTVFY